MIRLIINIFIQISSYASILGLYFSVVPPNQSRPSWHWVILGVFVPLVVFVLYHEIKEWHRLRPRIYKDKKKIQKYMCNWIRWNGRAAILSRDLSWADDIVVQEALFSKARDRELVIIIEKDIDLSNKLKEQGAEVFTYQFSQHIPRSRFTIMNFERDGARVAIGVGQNGKHVIQEFQSGEHPLYAVAEDVVKFIQGYNRGLSTYASSANKKP